MLQYKLIYIYSKRHKPSMSKTTWVLNIIAIILWYNLLLLSRSTGLLQFNWFQTGLPHTQVGKDTRAYRPVSSPYLWRDRRMETCCLPGHDWSLHHLPRWMEADWILQKDLRESYCWNQCSRLSNLPCQRRRIQQNLWQNASLPASESRCISQTYT